MVWARENALSGDVEPAGGRIEQRGEEEEVKKDASA